MKGKLNFIAGLLVGLSIISCTGAASAVVEALTATPSTQVFYVDGRQVALTAYAINGNNYVKLRDIGQAVGFNVYYEPSTNAAMMESGKPYTGKAPEVAPAKEPYHDRNYAEAANPSIFTNELTRGAYNAIRSSIVNKDAILSGAMPRSSFEVDSTTTDQLTNLMPILGLYPDFTLSRDATGKFTCNVRKLEVYDPAIAHTRSFIDGLKGKSEKAQVEAIVWYVCDRLSYSVEYPFVDEVLSQDGTLKGACATYAYCVQFLCDRAGIPCILVTSDTHQWNRVYVDGRWWDVDATGDDVPDPSFRSQMIILHPLGEKVTGLYEDYAPECTTFAMELLVPGSTK